VTDKLASARLLGQMTGFIEADRRKTVEVSTGDRHDYYLYRQAESPDETVLTKKPGTSKEVPGR